MKERDEQLETLWGEFEDVPMDPETECMEAAFLHFPAGTKREDIWHWFDERHSRGVGYLLCCDGVDRTDEIGRLYYLKQLCFDCETHDCAYNVAGECRYAMVHHRYPNITEDDGCKDGIIDVRR